MLVPFSLSLQSRVELDVVVSMVVALTTHQITSSKAALLIRDLNSELSGRTDWVTSHCCANKRSTDFLPFVQHNLVSLEVFLYFGTTQRQQNPIRYQGSLLSPHVKMLSYILVICQRLHTAVSAETQDFVWCFGSREEGVA